eukprot:TRINITY_DN22774_c0_g1_i1.p1 TRINITY_DN22774_c0_g1~~TRINITY_DN22774_c0_g1_i1.p1  ORF type:complete len:504 (-),score=77.66 TRINITY_DN22774_c0_g1_i1:268-1779(-)
MMRSESRPLTPAPRAAQIVRQSSVPVLRRPSTLGNSGAATPHACIYPPVRVLPPSGASTPAMPPGPGGSLAVPCTSATCPNCSNVIMPDAIFCRYCGEKREGAATTAYTISAPRASASTVTQTMATEPITVSSSYASPPVRAQALSSYSYAAKPTLIRSSTPLRTQAPAIVSTPSMPVAFGYVSTPSGTSTPATGASVPVTLSARPSVPPVVHPTVMAGTFSVPTPVPPVHPPGVLAHEALPNPVEPPVPPTLTEGIPDPASIEQQKANYAKALEDQLKQGTEVLEQQLKQQSEVLFQMGDQRKRQYALQVDKEIKQKEMELAQQHNEQLLLLQQAAQQQKSALEHQANALLLEYTQKKSQEDLIFQKYQFQKRQYDTQLQYNEEMRELQALQQAAASQVAGQKVAIAQHAVTATQQALVMAQQQARVMFRGSAPAAAVAPSTSSWSSASAAVMAPTTSFATSRPVAVYSTYLPETPPRTTGLADTSFASNADTFASARPSLG